MVTQNSVIAHVNWEYLKNELGWTSAINYLRFIINFSMRLMVDFMMSQMLQSWRHSKFEVLLCWNAKMQGFGNKIIKNTGSTKKLKISYAIVKIAVQSKNSDGNKQLIFLDK